MNELLEKYLSIVGEDIIHQLLQISAHLKGLKILHVNSTKRGGGVAEMLEKIVLLTQALGIDMRWETIEGDVEFFHCTKSFHNAIQGTHTVMSDSQLQHYEKINAANAERLSSIINNSDIVVIHDPQPVSLITHFPDRKSKWIWQCHIDASAPYKPVWNYLRKFVSHFDATVFSLPDFAQPLTSPTYIIPPSIDPLSEKNIDLEKKEIDLIYSLFGIDPLRPILLQVSRFDFFKDPLGVIYAYRLAKKFQPFIQLIFAGATATDDPESEIVLKEMQHARNDDPDIHILNLPSDSNRIINALQRAATIIIQKSIKEGFGLTVTEALWKAKPIIGGNAGGIRSQIINHQTGFLVNTSEGAANRIRFLLQYPEKGYKMGINGQVFVKDKFLITRQLREYFSLFISLFCPDTDRIELSRIRSLR